MSQTQWSSRTQSYEYTDPWLFEYLEGTAHAAFGFDLHQKFEGVGFGALVISVYGETGAIVLGVQAKGRVVLCPQAKGWRARAGMVCFAIARSSSSLDPVRLSRDDRTSWRNTFQVSRRLRRAQGVRRGRHLDAAEMIGLSLRRALMPPQGAGAGEGSLAGPDTPKYPSATWQPTIDTSLEITRDVSRELSSPTRRRRSFGRAEVAPPLQPSAPAEMQGAEAARALRESLQPGEDLMMLVVCEGGSWQMVRTFLRTLRQDHLPVIQPVVVLAPARAPPGLLEDYGFRVACMQGSCLQAQALVEAGLLEASTVVVLAGEPAEHSRLSDHNLILCAQVLDFWLGAFPNRVFVSFELRDSASARHLPKLRGKTVSEDRSDLHQWAMTGGEGSHWRGGEPLSPVGVINRRRSAGSLGITSSFTKHGEPAGDALAISRFTSGESARPVALDAETASASDPPLSPTRSCSAPLPTRRHSFLPFSLDVDAQEEIEMPMWLSDDDPDNGILEADSDNDEQLGAGIEDEGHRQRSPWDTLLESSGRSAVAEERSHESIMFHPRFAAGQIFTPELWGTMLGRMFYNPASIELIEALVMPASRGQHVYPWQLRVPTMYAGRPVADLIMDLCFGVRIRNRSMRLSRLSFRSGVSSNARELSVEHMATESPSGPPAVLIALYRLRAEFAPQSAGAAETPDADRDATTPTLAESAARARGGAERIGGHRYVMLAPPKDVELREGDCAIVFGGRAFGQGLYDRGLLHKE